MGPACKPGDGCFLDPCDENVDCLSGWCVDHLGESVCTQPCTEECPPGWMCQQVAGTYPDLVYVCVSNFANLCRPCAAGHDCKSVGGSEDVCVDYGEEGSFCGGTCSETGDCPPGFSCLNSLTVDGLELLQCVADGGVCPCTGQAVKLALWTPCEVVNQWGVCPGKRVCLEEGLSACDAAIPGAESCNGLDDECDGMTDEPAEAGGELINLCDDGNDCTTDVCLGAEGCEHEDLDSGECKDGDACTVGDHCDQGVCLGLPIVCDDSNPCTDDLCDGLGGCSVEFNSEPCDDEDPCTVNDTCGGGICAGFAVDCECQDDADCAALEDDDLCNGTLVCDTSKLPFACAVDPASVVFCPQPAGPAAICQEAQCDPETGVCSTVAAHEGFACDDGDACTVGDQCVEMVCVPGGAANCNDGNICTDDSCDSLTGCVHQANGGACSDNNVCTSADYCAGGKCAGGELLDCDDGNICTDDGCQAAVGCTHVANDQPCSDGNECTKGDQCQAGSCAAGGLENCDDSNLCTADSCDPALGCVYEFLSAPCDDGDDCTVNDKCFQGQCQGGAQLNCDDSNPCTDDSCDVTGICLHLANQAECSDDNACTTGDHCAGGHCVVTGELQCVDDNICTLNECDPVAGCVALLHDGPCDDQNVCTTSDHCHLGACISTGTLQCDDGNLCTDDDCNPDTGCAYVHNQLGCDDDNACTLDDQCTNGWCQGKTVMDCDDSNPCTNDSCHPAAGCLNGANNASCDDGDICTLGDFCQDKVCQPGPQGFSCDDDNPCTVDSCDSQEGCAHLPGEGDCTDGDACTVGDHCQKGLCIPGAETLECDDQNPCTDDWCDHDAGCLSEADDSNSCSDDDVCTPVDLCQAGTCTGTGSLACDDSNPCTENLCDAVDGCQYPAVANCCGNGIVEAGEVCDDGNQNNNDGCTNSCTKNSGSCSCKFTGIDGGVVTVSGSCNAGCFGYWSGGQGKVVWGHMCGGACAACPLPKTGCTGSCPNPQCVPQ